MKALWLVLLCLVFAGCNEPIGKPADEPRSPVDDELPPLDPIDPVPQDVAMLLRFGFEDCTGSTLVGHASLDVVQAALPGNYTAWSDPSQPTPTGHVGLAMVRCATFTTNVGTFNDTALGFVEARIEDPGHGVDADQHWYRARVLAEQGVMTELWGAAGYDVATGAFEHTPTLDAGLLVERWTTLFGDYTSNLNAASEQGLPDLDLASYTEVAQGRLEWTASYVPGAQHVAAGSIGRAADDPFAAAWDQVAVAQGHIGSASWNENNLWLRVKAP